MGKFIRNTVCRGTMPIPTFPILTTAHRERERIAMERIPPSGVQLAVAE
jgi:hypothetical protein